MPEASPMEWVRFAVSLVGVAATIWCCWDSVLDALAIYGVELQARLPPLVAARWKAVIEPQYLARAGDQRFSALCILHRVLGRLVMLVVQLVLSISALLEPNAGTDWKLIAQMIGVAGLTANAFSDRIERHKLIEHIKPQRSRDSC